MRNFIVVGHRAVTNPNFTLNDLPGSSGRMDILARCVNSAFLLSHDIRRDVEVTIILLGPEEPPKTIRFIGSELKYLNPDERSTGALIRNALVKSSVLRSKTNSSNSNTGTLKNEIKTSPGIYISKSSFEEVIQYYSKNSATIYLHESGADASSGELDIDNKKITFVLSDDKNLTADEEEMVKKYSSSEITIGPKMLHSEHCIILIHNILDRLKFV